jgi:hypothetical protein
VPRDRDRRERRARLVEPDLVRVGDVQSAE